jgi:hypothetical protein
LTLRTLVCKHGQLLRVLLLELLLRRLRTLKLLLQSPLYQSQLRYQAYLYLDNMDSKKKALDLVRIGLKCLNCGKEVDKSHFIEKPGHQVAKGKLQRGFTGNTYHSSV